MKATTPGFKSILANGGSRQYLIKVDLELTDGTIFHLTEADIWEDSFGIETASSGTSSFDIGTAVIGKCTFTINNISGNFDNYDFFNAEAVVWLGLVGDVVNDVQQYYRMGFFTVDEPERASGLISLSLLDNMWKFDVPFSNVNISYPITAVNAVLAICSYCGVSLAGSSANFHGYNFSIAEAPKDVDNMNCREMLQYIAMIGCNFCTINDAGYLEIKWYDVNATAETTDVFELNQRTSFGTTEIEITGVKFVIDNTPYLIGSAGYVLELQNPLVNASNVNAVLNSIWAILDGFTLTTYNVSCASDLAAEIGDKVKIIDYKGNYTYSWLTLNSFKLAGHQIQCTAEPPQRTLVKRYSKTVQAAVEVARQQTNEIISNYDLAVQMMNDLAVNAMGGYEDYEDISTGGRVWYLSNMPITKVNNVCSFEPNSIVYKRTGSGFFVSRDGGITWVNGYDSQTGELVVNVLDAIGINFDWARGGTLTLGGYGNGNGVLSIQNASNVEKVHGDNTGISAGGNGNDESKVKISTEGAIEYYFDGGLSPEGEIKMDAFNHGSQSDPDIRDTLMIRNFSNIDLRSEDGRSNIHLATVKSGNDYDGSIEFHAEKEESGDTNEANLTLDGDGLHIDGHIFIGNDRAKSQIYDFVGTDFKRHTAEYNNGLLTAYTVQTDEVPHSEWHTWTSGGTTYSAIVLSAGVSQAVFPDIDTSDDYGYAPYIKCASGVDAPVLTATSISGTSFTAKFTEVTSAQAGSGDCVIKLLKTKG